jgi:hypothetical protein
MAMLSNVGQKVDFQIRQGSDFGPVKLTFTNPDGTPVNLTGATLQAQIRKNVSDATQAASFTFNIVNAAQGIASMKLTSFQTAALQPGATIDDPGGRYIWDMELVDSSGSISSPMYGDLQVMREVTRV